MAKTETAGRMISEMREFAGFSAEEQLFIERSLDIGLGRGDAYECWSNSAEDDTAIRAQYLGYRALDGLRAELPSETSLGGVEDFMGLLIRITAQDLAFEQITRFSSYRFLYERLMGAAIRPWLPAAFCGAAALPQIRPERRKMLLQSLSEAAATAQGWSEREPSFFPGKIDSEAA